MRKKIVNPLFPAAGTSGKALYSPQVWNFRVSRRENYARSGLHFFVEEGPSGLLRQSEAAGAMRASRLVL